MASLLMGPPKDENGNVKKIPKVAVYVAGAAFAVTTGLTLLVLPFVRQAARMQNTPTFLSNRHLARTIARPSALTTGADQGVSATGMATAPDAGIHSATATPSMPQISTEAGPSRIPPPLTSHPVSPSPIHSELSSSNHQRTISPEKYFNDTEERALYGSIASEATEHEYVSPWLGAQALGLATILVMGSAGLGMWGVAKFMGVQSMDEFASKMRETLQIKMPALSAAIARSDTDAEADMDGEEDAAIPVDHLDPGLVIEGDGAQEKEYTSWKAVWRDMVKEAERDP